MGLKYGERGISEAMVPTESAGRHRGIRLTSRRGSWRWQELWGRGSRTAQNGSVAAAVPGSPPPTAAREPPFSPRLPRPRITRASPVGGSALPSPHPPPPVLVVCQASGGCSVPRGRPIARRGGAGPTPSRRGPGAAGSADRAAGRGQAEA